VLRKLFISLLILSALTSKGVVDPLLNTLELYTPNSLSNLIGGLDLPKDRSSGEEAGARLQSRALSLGNSILPLEEILNKGNLKSLTFCDLAQNSNTNSNMAAVLLEVRQYRHLNSVAVSYASDLSPPKV
jgi:hypothetical protein